MSDEDEHAMNADEVDSDQKVQTLRNVAASLYSSLSGLSNSSRTIPSEKDFHFYRNFDEFRSPIEEISRSSCSLLQSLGSSALTWGKELAFPEDIDDAYDWLVNVNDEVLERFDLSIDEFGNTRKAEGEGGKRAMEVEDGFQLVSGKKKNKEMRNQAAGSASTRQESSVKVANLKEKKVSGAKQKIPFHIPTIRKPQEEFNILVNNVNQPFQHVWLQRSEDGQRFVHPLEKVSVLDFSDTSAGKIEPVKPPPIETTPFSLIEAVKDLKEMAAKLRSVNEFAVDLEHNQYRSFQGLTCLMQISTRDEDFVVDTLKLRIHIGPYLREVFKDPTKRKVMHGADRDIVWLQRDFGIYVCNMFDTGQASRVLKLERNSLEYLLHHYCGVTANKEYQNADWRIRPLPNEMIRYAREDTHYLLHIYDVMRNELLSVSENSNDTLLEVYTRSFDICIQLYEKELLTEKSYLGIYGLLWADFNARQIAVVAGLYEWRDIVARAEDESTGFILPNKTLLEIAKQMPVTGSKLHGLLKSRHPYVERNLSSVINIIRHSVQNADAYEAVVEYLKERRKEMASLSSLLASDGSQAEPPDNPSDPIEGAVECINDSSTISQSYIDSGSQEVIPEHDAGDGRDQFSTDQSKATNINTSSSSLNSPNISAVASVEVLKKPGGAFGAFLGKPGPKRKFHTDEKDKKETKLEQIRSSVNLPFHSFLGSEAVSNMTPPAVVEESTGGLETQSSQGCAIVPISGSNAEDIIMLEDDNDAEEPAADDSETGKDLEGTDGGKPNVEDDQNYESMSLTDLSSSFQRCLESMKQNKKGGQVKKSQEMSGLSMVKPFDYESARRDIRFGEDKRGLVTEGEGEGLKSILNSGGRKNSLAIDQFKKDDESRLPQGRRRQAFPASGNRSATFR